MTDDERRALDLAMARLCGYPVVQCQHKQTGKHVIPASFPCVVACASVNLMTVEGDSRWQPSRDPAQALEVAEALRRQNYYYQALAVPAEDRPYAFWFQHLMTPERRRWPKHHSGPQETLPLAICLAAKAAQEARP